VYAGLAISTDAIIHVPRNLTVPASTGDARRRQAYLEKM
jgi:hypothetical protein